MLTVLVALIGVAIALLGLFAIVRDQFWPVALIALILLSFGVMQAEGSRPTVRCSSINARGAKGQRARREFAGGARALPLRQNRGQASLPRP
jgi:hypothetical protein